MCRIIWLAPLMIVALVAHLNAQQIPLDLDRIIALHNSEPGVWDLAPLPQSESALVAHWVANVLYFRLESEPMWSSVSPVSGFYGLFLDQNGLTCALIVTGNNDIQQIPLPEGSPAITLLSWPNTDDSGPYYYSHNHSSVTEARFVPAPPLQTERIFVHGTNYFSYSWYGQSSSGTRDRLGDIPSGGGICGNYLFDTAAGALLSVFHRAGDGHLIRGCVWWHHSNSVGWFYNVGFVDIQDTLRDSTACYSGVIDYPVLGPNTLGTKGIVFARTNAYGTYVLAALAKAPGGRSDSIFAVQHDYTGLAWAAAANYTRLFAADLYENVPGDEVIGLLPSTRQLGVHNSGLGTLIGTTTPFEGDSLDVKIISPQVSQSLRLAVRDGNQVRLYRFGVPTAAEPRQPRSIQSDDTHITASPQPAHESVRFTFSGDMNLAREIILYDLLGREVNHLVLNPQQTSAVFSTSSLPSGIYFATVRGSISSRPHKFVVLH